LVISQLLKHKGLRKRYVPKMYVVDEPPITVDAGGKRYECKSIAQTQTGILCVQHDNTVVVIPSPPPTPDNKR